LPQQLSQHEQHSIAAQIRQWAAELGFAQVGIADIELAEHEAYLQKWLDAGYHGSMEYMARHGVKRARPEERVPGTCRVITLRMDYLADGTRPQETLGAPQKAYISRYALGRDYHKLVRKRLATLADRIAAMAGGGQYRAFVDSAPVLERALAERAGMGWIAKNTMLINADAGSWFFLGEIYTDLPLPPDEPQATKHCGTCTACLDICPTQAFTGPFQLDARKCISYLTIEHKGSIDPALRPLMGNRVFGCDDCQLVCPWNKFARRHDEPDFRARNDLDRATLAQLFAWDQDEFLQRTEGSAIRRSGHARWLRNIAVALGNAPTTPEVLAALRSRRDSADPVVREHVEWALARHATSVPPR
jgi:epoxyqueuosine reductase